MGCAEEHKEIVEKLDLIEGTLEFHTGEVHASFVPPEQILLKEEALGADKRIEEQLTQFSNESKADRKEIHRQLDEMADVVLGEKHVDFDKKITRTGGMKAMVQANENGGLRFKYANLIITSLVAVVLALIGLGGVVIQHQDDTAHVIDQVMEEVQNQLEDIIELELAEVGK